MNDSSVDRGSRRVKYPKHGIPTKYKGINFRSRLEATWAAFFDLCGWRWEYEPIDLAGYIPDFVLLGHTSVFVDVKPISTEREMWTRLAELSDHSAIMVVGVGPIGHKLGVIVDPSTGVPWRSFAICSECMTCGMASLVHEDLCAVNPWPSYSCGHKSHAFEFKGMKEAWAKAKNATQWRPVK